MDPGYLFRAAVLIYTHRALSVSSSIFGCCQGKGKERGGKEGLCQEQFPGRIRALVLGSGHPFR